MSHFHAAKILFCALALLTTSARGEAESKPAGKAAGGVEGRYQIQMIRTGASTFAVLRWNERTGATWYLSQGNWILVKDPEPIPVGNYVITAASLDNNWGAVRHDPITGRSWIVDSGSWQPIPEAPLISPPAPAANPLSEKK